MLVARLLCYKAKKFRMLGALSFLQKRLDYMRSEDAAHKFMGTINELLFLIAVGHIRGKSAKEIKEKFDEVNLRLNQMYLELPNTSDKAVEIANKALMNNEYSYTDAEIDRFLVSSLKGKVK